MTPDVIGVVAVFVAAVTFLGGVAGLLAQQTRRLESRFESRFDRVESEIASMRNELTEVKIAIARIEGPWPGLLCP